MKPSVQLGAFLTAVILLLTGCTDPAATTASPEKKSTVTHTTATSSSPTTTATASVPSTTLKTTPPSLSTGTSHTTPPPFLPLNATITVAGTGSCYFGLDKNENAWNKRIVEELEYVEKMLGCQFKFHFYSSSKLTEQCILADKAGDQFCDVLMTTVQQQKPLMAARALTDLNGVSRLNLGSDYFDQASQKDMRLFGKNFIAFTTLDNPASNANVIYFNKKLAQQALSELGTNTATPNEAADKLYGMVRRGEWTFDAMQQLSQKAARDLNGNGKLEVADAGRDQFGFTGVDFRDNVGYSLFKAKGGYFTKTDSQGNIIYALSDAVNITAFKVMQTWLLKDTSVYNADHDGSNHMMGQDLFFSGHALFLGWDIAGTEELSTMVDDWGILPYPKADANSDYVSVAGSNAHGFSIPRTLKGEALSNAAIVIDAIARRLHSIRQEKDKYLKARILRDADSLEMLQLAQKNAHVDLVQFCEMGEGGLSTLHYLMDDKTNDPATRIKKVRETAIKTLNDFLKKVK